jgi:NAD dependent epimerase/dehydratase family.
MNVAILGATSEIAKDLLREWFAQARDISLDLYARNVDKVNEFLSENSVETRVNVFSVDRFPVAKNNIVYDAVINFIGVGDPSKAQAMASSIQDITFYYDDLVIQYLKDNPKCKYIFLSSGAAYGSDYSDPASLNKRACFDINNIQLSAKYGLAKFITEVKHRELEKYQICDLRVFNYFSRHQNMDARFFITDLFRAVKTNTVCEVSPESMVRDYLHPKDFCQIIDCLLRTDEINSPFDCYSLSPVDKVSLLDALEKEFNLKWKFTTDIQIVRATGNKCNYYSENRALESVGYKPQFSSLDTILTEFKAILSEG